MKSGALDLELANRSANVAVRLRALLIRLAAGEHIAEEDIDKQWEEYNAVVRIANALEGRWQSRVILSALKAISTSGRCKRLVASSSSGLGEERERLACHCEELDIILREAPSELAGRARGSFAMSGRGLDIKNLATVLLEMPMSIAYWKVEEGMTSRMKISQTVKANGKQEASPLVRLIAFLDNSPLVTTRNVRPSMSYSLGFEVRGVNWPSEAVCLHFDLVTTCPASEYSCSPLVLERPKDGAEFDGMVRGQIVFRTAQSILSDALAFSIMCRFEVGTSHVEAKCIGHTQLSFRVLEERSFGIASRYKHIDHHLMELVAEILRECPSVSGELTDLLPLLTSLNAMLGTYAQSATFKSTVNISEAEFQKQILRDLRLLLGEGVKEGIRQGGGITDIVYNGIVVELKVEKVDGDRRAIANAYSQQATQYEGVEARQVAIVLVLDVTPKSNPPGDIRNDVLLTSVPTHGGVAQQFPSKALVFVVNGNLQNPSAYST